jgi:carbon monoxide dehydrogenase subunit G
MNIEGTYTLLAPPGRVWHAMLEQQILLHTVPGIKQIEALDKHTFAIALTINQTPFIGNYEGTFTLSEQQFPSHYLLAIQIKSEQEQFHGKISIQLHDREHSTIVAYTGTIHLASMQQSTPTTLARGAAKLLIQQFFTALDEQLSVNDITIFPPQSSSISTHYKQKGLFYTFIRLLKLGDGEPEQEQIWARRLRRASAISSLLLLVWIGTRLPRQRGKS